MAIAALTALLPSNVYASDTCGPLKPLNQVQMTRNGFADLVPVTINGVPKNFLFDTGGYYTQVSRPVADALELPILQGKNQMSDITGRVSHDQASVREFVVGNMHSTDLDFPISPTSLPIDGVFALDHWTTFDLDVDFGTDMLNIFSQDHCPGGGQYWTAPAMAVFPITMKGFHIYIPVTLDGHELLAAIDTGENYTSLTTDDAKPLFSLDLGSEETPEAGGVNGNTSLKVYTHIFNSLALGDIAVNNPKIAIVPNVASNNANLSPLVGEPAKTETEPVNRPDLIIGMDVLRQLHVYFAFGENKMYASMASAPPTIPTQAAPALSIPLAPAAEANSLAPMQSQTDAQRAENEAKIAAEPQSVVQSAYKQYAAQRIAELDHLLTSDPDNVQGLSSRCYTRAAVKSNLDKALADCDQAIRLMPGNPDILEVRAFVLYQQGNYQQALDTYNATLALKPEIASALFVRGCAKGKLGDVAGKDADIAAAKAIQANIEIVFKPFDFIE
jgi:predicted aspartyl protease